ncbi:hypothetical protein ARSEF1564_008426 [Beauveria bassiana]
MHTCRQRQTTTTLVNPPLPVPTTKPRRLPKLKPRRLLKLKPRKPPKLRPKKAAEAEAKKAAEAEVKKAAEAEAHKAAEARKRAAENPNGVNTSTGYLLVTDPQTSHSKLPCARAGYLVRRSDYATAAAAFQDAANTIAPSSPKTSLDGKALTDFIWWTVAYNGRLCYAYGVLDDESTPRLFARTVLKDAFGKVVDRQIDEIRESFKQPDLMSLKAKRKTQTVAFSSDTRRICDGEGLEAVAHPNLTRSYKVKVTNEIINQKPMIRAVIQAIADHCPFCKLFTFRRVDAMPMAECICISLVLGEATGAAYLSSAASRSVLGPNTKPEPEPDADVSSFLYICRNANLFRHRLNIWPPLSAFRSTGHLLSRGSKESFSDM